MVRSDLIQVEEVIEIERHKITFTEVVKMI